MESPAARDLASMQLSEFGGMMQPSQAQPMANVYLARPVSFPAIPIPFSGFAVAEASSDSVNSSLSDEADALLDSSYSNHDEFVPSHVPSAYPDPELSPRTAQRPAAVTAAAIAAPRSAAALNPSWDEDTVRVRPNTRSRKRKLAASKAARPAAGLKSDDTATSTAKPKACEADDEDGNCIICLCEPESDELAKINGCSHQFCFECIEKWSERENSCPLCKKRFTKIDRVNKAKRQKTENAPKKKNSKKVKQRDQRSDIHPANALEGIISGMFHGAGPPHLARLIVSSGLGSDSFFTTRAHRTRGGPRRSVSLRLRQHTNSSTGSISANVNLNIDESDDDNNQEEEGFLRFRNNLTHRAAVLGGFPMFPAHVHRAAVASGRAMHFATRSYQPARSHATNAHDATAGGSADNALEIVDDSEDEIEVLDVRRGRSA